MTTALYTPDVLALTIELANFRLDGSFPLTAEARSRSCGSSLALGLSLSDLGTVERVGIRTQACAIGQASAAIFALSAQGRLANELLATSVAVSRWLAGDSALPDWPNFDIIAKARDYPARHGAILLPWTAAAQILPTSKCSS